MATLQFIGNNSVIILSIMAAILGGGFLLDHIITQFEAEESEINTNPLD